MAPAADGEGEFDAKLSESPCLELLDLAHFLTSRRGKASKNMQHWIHSETVDVLVVDIYVDSNSTSKSNPRSSSKSKSKTSSSSSSSISIHAHDLTTLQNYATLDLPSYVALRLFLVESISTPAFEVLRRAYACPSALFGDHIAASGRVLSLRFNDEGELASLTDAPKPSRVEKQQLWAPLDYGKKEHFSVPFRRGLQDGGEVGEMVRYKSNSPSPNASAWFRERDDGNLEERVSGFLKRIPSPSSSSSSRSGSGSPGAQVAILFFDAVGATSASESESEGRQLSGQSLRSALLRRLDDPDFCKLVREDASIVLDQLLSFIATEWLAVLSSDKTYSPPADGDSTASPDLDEILSEMQEAFAEFEFSSSITRKSDPLLSNLLAAIEYGEEGKPASKTTSTEIVKFRKSVNGDFARLCRRMRERFGSDQLDGEETGVSIFKHYGLSGIRSIAGIAVIIASLVAANWMRFNVDYQASIWTLLAFAIPLFMFLSGAWLLG